VRLFKANKMANLEVGRSTQRSTQAFINFISFCQAALKVTVKLIKLQK